MLRLVLGLWLACAQPREEPAPPPLPIELHWSAPDECPDREAFLEAMTAIAGRRLVPSPAAALAVDGQIEASRRGYVLQLRLRGSTDEELRSLEASECEALVSAGSLVVVTRLLGAAPPPSEDPPTPQEETPSTAPTKAAVPEPSPPPATDGPQPPLAVDDDEPVAPPSEPGPRPEPKPPDRPSPQATLVALTGLAVGLGPRPAGLVRGGVGLRWGSVRVEAFAMHVLATTTGGRGEPGVRAWLTGAGTLACWAPSRGRLEIPLCGGLELGAFVGRGTGPLVARADVSQLWVGLPFEAGIAWAPLPRLALRALVGGDIGLRRPGFHVDVGAERTAIARAWPVGLHAGGGLEVRLP